MLTCEIGSCPAQSSAVVKLSASLQTLVGDRRDGSLGVRLDLRFSQEWEWYFLGNDRKGRFDILLSSVRNTTVLEGGPCDLLTERGRVARRIREPLLCVMLETIQDFETPSRRRFIRSR